MPLATSETESPTSVGSPSGEPVQAPVPRFSSGDGRVDHLGPRLGEHNAEVYGELGLTPDQIDELRARGVL